VSSPSIVQSSCNRKQLVVIVDLSLFTFPLKLFSMRTLGHCQKSVGGRLFSNFAFQKYAMGQSVRRQLAKTEASARLAAVSEQQGD
jgi:hypothetical protein